MTFRINWRAQAFVVPAVMLALSSALSADTFERPPSTTVDKIRGIKPAGPNYTVNNPVRSDGLFHLYTLATPYGQFTVQGDLMLQMRINELVALAELEKLSQSDQFSKAMLNAGISPVKYAGKLITNPVGTIQNTFAGVGSFLGSVGSGVTHAGRTQDDTVSSLIGVTKERRALAAKFGVDPYTDFEPLAAKLKTLSEAAALGGLAVTGAMMAIPGTAGIVVSNISTANMLGDMRVEELARSYTAAQILDLNLKRLAEMGIDKALSESLLSNRNYTPIDLAAMVAALESMRGVADKVVFVRRAAGVTSRGNAYAMRKHAEMAAAYAKSHPVARFVSLGGFPFNQARDGTVIGVMPVDLVSWTDVIAKHLNQSSADRSRIGAAKAELRLHGRATSLAKQRLQALGWRVVENVRI